MKAWLHVLYALYVQCCWISSGDMEWSWHLDCASLSQPQMANSNPTELQCVGGFIPLPPGQPEGFLEGSRGPAHGAEVAVLPTELGNTTSYDFNWRRGEHGGTFFYTRFFWQSLLFLIAEKLLWHRTSALTCSWKMLAHHEIFVWKLTIYPWAIYPGDGKSRFSMGKRGKSCAETFFPISRSSCSQTSHLDPFFQTQTVLGALQIYRFACQTHMRKVGQATIGPPFSAQFLVRGC